ncbi:amino acid permease [Carboxylicivirga mesophila]|uniref:Amino acid permease n=1 Tax=Carboxylicivirga mesophila TaxID=1166478 RepID=A0ABS5KBG3_9BACT|nr:APC family permease [Carboxylicivirga mesophila]MBS2212276.1 amino acid permease [Carboxylicivirga mesophila]
MSKVKRELSLLEVISVSSGVMISSGLFILPAIAYAQTGPAMILSYAIASLMIIPTVLAKSELVTAMPVTGGIYIFADRSMGPLMGTIGGLTAWISLAFKSAFSLLAMGIFVILLKPDITEMQMKIISVAWCLIFTALNIKGVKFSGRFQTTTVIILVLILLMYITVGAFSVETERFVPFAPEGFDAIFMTAGLIFIAFSGTTKVTAIAGEVKNPGRNLPLGIFSSWGIVSLLYVAVVFITVGILNPDELNNTFTPISIGGQAIMGRFGIVIMTLAALLAFISTGNAGLLAASRNPLAMGKDELLPGFFTKLSSAGTPVTAILFTGGLMIAVIIFLDIETFVKTASALKLVLFIIANIALIFMREANINHYRPKYRAPFYPWAQIIGIICYIFLLIEMGTMPLLFVLVFIIGGIAWYFVYAHGRIKREYAILHLIERVTGIKTTDQLLEEELREILVERDGTTHQWYEQFIRQQAIMEIANACSAEEFAKQAAPLLSLKIKVNEQWLIKRLAEKLNKADSKVADGVACLIVPVKGNRKFELMLFRSHEGIATAHSASVHTIMIIAYSKDEWNLQLHTLSRLIKAIKSDGFLNDWLSAGNNQQLHQLLLKEHKK